MSVMELGTLTVCYDHGNDATLLLIPGSFAVTYAGVVPSVWRQKINALQNRVSIGLTRDHASINKMAALS